MGKRRECLDCPEREHFVSEIRRKGRSELYARQMNRYIDEFLRFCRDKYGHASPTEVTSEQIRAFAQSLGQSTFTAATYNPAKRIRSRITSHTALLKVSAVLKWCKWLHETSRIEQNPAEELSSTDLLGSGVTDD